LIEKALGDLTNCIIAYQNYDKAWALSLEGAAKSTHHANCSTVDVTFMTGFITIQRCQRKVRCFTSSAGATNIDLTAPKSLECLKIAQSDEKNGA